MATPKRRSRRIAGQRAFTTDQSTTMQDQSQMLGTLIEREPTPELPPSINTVINRTSDAFQMPGRFPSSFLESRSTSITGAPISYPTLPEPPAAPTSDQSTMKSTTTTTTNTLTTRTSGDGSSEAAEHREDRNEMPSARKAYRATSPLISGPSSTFEFRFARPSAELGSEAQKMMDDLREEALRIRERLESDQAAAQRHNDEVGTAMYGGGGGSTVGGRKMAKPKGRFSDAHSQQFGKMSSIAGHPAAARSQKLSSKAEAQSIKAVDPGAMEKAASTAGARRGLKRTSAMAGLNVAAAEQEQRSHHGHARKPDARNIECVGTPQKRVKMSPIKEGPSCETPKRRPLIHPTENKESLHHPAINSAGPSRIPRSRSGLPSPATGPTAASLARSQSVKHLPSSPTPIPSPSPHRFNPLPVPGSAPASILRSCLSPSTPLAPKSPIKPAIKMTTTASSPRPPTRGKELARRMPATPTSAPSAAAARRPILTPRRMAALVSSPGAVPSPDTLGASSKDGGATAATVAATTPTVKTVSFSPCTKPAAAPGSSDAVRHARLISRSRAERLRARFADWVRSGSSGGSSGHGSDEDQVRGRHIISPRARSTSIAMATGMNIFGEQQADTSLGIMSTSTTSTATTAPPTDFTFRIGSAHLSPATVPTKPLVFGPANRARTIRAVRPSDGASPAPALTTVAPVFPTAATTTTAAGAAGRTGSLSTELAAYRPGGALQPIFEERSSAPATPSSSTLSPRKRSRAAFEMDEDEGRAEKGGGMPGKYMGNGGREEQMRRNHERPKEKEHENWRELEQEQEQQARRKRVKTDQGDGGGLTSRIPTSARKPITYAGMTTISTAITDNENAGIGSPFMTKAAADAASGVNGEHQINHHRLSSQAHRVGAMGAALRGIGAGRLNTLTAPRRR